MNNRRKINKLFVGIDEMSLPAIEKMLPPEALVKRKAPVIEKRKAFPKLAVASLAIVALAVATGLVIGSVAGGNEKQLYPNNNLVLNNDIENTSTPSILENEASDNGASAEHTSTEESEVSRKDMPIVSCGKYGRIDNSSTIVYPGGVAMRSMDGSRSDIDIDGLQCDVLYAVCFRADFFQYTEYEKGIQQIEEEARENSWSPREELEKMEEFYNSINEIATADMYNYLEEIGIEFYDKNVYTVNSTTNAEEIVFKKTFRVAFITKEQIKALKGGDIYGIVVEIAFDELAKMDDEPVYVKSGLWSVDC